MPTKVPTKFLSQTAIDELNLKRVKTVRITETKIGLGKCGFLLVIPQ